MRIFGEDLIIMIVCYFAGALTVIFHHRIKKHKCKDGKVLEQRKGTTTYKSCIGLGSYKESVLLTRFQCNICGEQFYTAKTITGEDIGYSQEYIKYLFTCI